MDPSLEALVRRYCKDAMVIARNEASREVLGKLGIASRAGTDTAWTFEPAPAEVGRGILTRAGWDGEAPVLVVCPINPFWWPVRADLGKAAAHALSGAYGDDHYASVYFHAGGPEVEEKQARYIDALAGAVRRFQAKHDCFPVMVGMEQLDRRACEALDRALGGGHPVIVSDEHDMFEMVSVLRQASMLVSSRYHAIVTSMPGLVPSAGVTMDERIRNLMHDRGQPHLLHRVDDADLEEALARSLERLWTEAAAVREGIGRCVVQNLERMGAMGMILVDHIREHHPDFPIREGLGEGGDPWAHLPPLPPHVQALVDTYAD